MLRPFAAYLRVYEPLIAFGDPPDTRLQAAATAAASDGLTAARAGHHEQVAWLKTQVDTTPRLLPAELADGRPVPEAAMSDLLVCEPEDIPGGQQAGVGPGPLLCPLELRARSAAALQSFLGEAHPALQSVVVSGAASTVDSVRARVNSVRGELSRSAMHVLSVNWSIPLPWFTLVDPAQRKLVLGSGPHDLVREVSWRVAMPDARHRVAEARELAERNFGDEGPAKILADTERWLTSFHPKSGVELDYGGLVQLTDDATLESDTTAQDVHAIVDALHSGDIERVTDLYQGLQEYWGELAASERNN